MHMAGSLEPGNASRMPYRTLNADNIVATLEQLHRRVSERFPQRGLAEVVAEVLVVAKKNRRRAIAVGRPLLLVRLGVAAVIISGFLVFLWAVSSRAIELPNMGAELNGDGTFDLFQGAEALVNLLVLTGAGVFFLTTLEERIKRARALEDIHELRSLAHVIDMHQLTKDPTAILDGPRTKSSPERTMSAFELTRYLDYCTEMLSLIGKIAALYAQNVRDPVVINAVNDIETLSTGLSRKVWQKIMIIRRMDS